MAKKCFANNNDNNNNNNNRKKSMPNIPFSFFFIFFSIWPSPSFLSSPAPPLRIPPKVKVMQVYRILPLLARRKSPDTTCKPRVFRLYIQCELKKKKKRGGGGGGGGEPALPFIWHALLLLLGLKVPRPEFLHHPIVVVVVVLSRPLFPFLPFCFSFLEW